MTTAETGAQTGTDLQVIHGPDAPATRRRRFDTSRFDVTGLALAAALMCVSLTPSLLPRSPAYQGFLSGIVAAAGYGLGAALAALLRLAARPVLGGHRHPVVPPPVTRVTRVVVLAGAGVTIAGFLVAGRRWQVEAHQLVGQEPPGPFAPVLIVLLTAGTFLALVALGRALRGLSARVSRVLARRLPVAVAGTAGVVVVAISTVTLVDQVLLRAALAFTDRVSSAVNDGTVQGATRPTDPARSGGPGSLVDWDDLGLQGRKFVAGGPGVQQLSEFSGREARSPVRVYVGLNSAADARERARLAVAELDRTGAFDRKVLCVVTTTGTGWVDSRAADGLEYLYGGDTAIVATQYSYLPSPVSFLFDDDQVEKEAPELFAQIRARWLQLPADRRPKLVLYGESLGSNGGQAQLADGTGATGALFAGPPNSNELWRATTDARDPGTPERLPVYQDGRTVRFAGTPADLAARTGPWDRPRVLFLQNASDPVVWWSPDLLLRSPDWLTEPRGDDVTTSMSWYPLVTFFQVTADLVEANAVPTGSGHRYGAMIADGWAALVPPDGWTAADTVRLRAAIG